MEVPRRYIDGYDETLGRSVAGIQNELRKSLELIDYSRPMEEVRTEVVALMDAYCDAAASAGARLSSEFYNGLRKLVTGKTSVLSLQTGRNPAATEGAVRAFVDRLLEGDVEGFEDLLFERVELEAKRAAAYNTIDNVRNDPDRPRFARVPQGEKTCDFCLMLASRGPVYLTEESAGAFTKYHAHCVTGNTRVMGNGLLAGLRREYEGPLVRILTKGGRELSVTPSHPVLTASGWVLAGEVKEGDRLVCTRFGDGHIGGVPDIEDVPPTAKEVFESSRLINATTLNAMPRTAEYLDGEDAAECDIEIVNPYGFLQRAVDSTRVEPLQHEGFAVADGRVAVCGLPLDRDGSGNLCRDGNLPATNRVVGGCRLIRTLLGCHFGGSDDPSRACVSGFDSGVEEPPVHDLAADAVTHGYLKHAVSALERFNDPFGGRDSLAKSLDAVALEYSIQGGFTDFESLGNLLGAFFGEIELDYALLVSVSEVACHVYDLSTAGGWYVSSGIIAHNCDCKVVPFWNTVEDGASRRKGVTMTIEGYDPDAYYREYKKRMEDPFDTFADRMAKGAERAKERAKSK